MNDNTMYLTEVVLTLPLILGIFIMIAAPWIEPPKKFNPKPKEHPWVSHQK